MASNDSRPTLLLLHGGGLGPWSYNRHVSALASDFRCLVPLLASHGSRVHEPFVWHEAVKELAAYLESEGDPAYVTGLSLGGQLGLALAAERPDLVCGLFVTGANTNGIPMVGATMKVMRPFMRLKNIAWFSRLNAKQMSVPPKELAAFLEGSRGLTMQAMRSFLQASSDFRAPDGLRQFDKAALVVRGEKESGVIKRSVPEVAAMIPAGHGRMVPKLSHPWPLQNPGLFVEVCRRWFLDGVIPDGLVSI